MIEKYILSLDEIIEGKGRPVIALKFNPEKRILTIGGNKFFKRNINSVMKHFFDLDFTEYELKFTQQNKIRYEIKNFTDDKFYSGLDNIENQGLQIQPTTNLLNIMR